MTMSPAKMAIDQSRFHLRYELLGPEEPCSRWGLDLPMGIGIFMGSYWACPDLPALIFFTLFAGGQQRCDVLLAVL